ncbi:tRNA (adenosine(37)-N6)-dimethylallyltransferase MiaA [Parvularcula sp. LCG005]|uniref:tRNA (adenosine(37)-N6)-dimethylallyltransferase MiaA n=1 Tax=Parvularcula sp. LCG005 TaxID=3078805 RepID=UPI002942DEBB|nr:tRNA (adenosine(37)-N6)-dimethylallyltransferase MiaA [Parvularcula sp. LCG005]WOI52240.1 tRNA (adenosine(37)-N6)-dimethylallyltransferase MiaA [Parvularcula sp. LCG005]
MSNAVVIAGPTASGKSAVAINLARQINGEIVNADAMQVYAELHRLTARPSPEDEAEIPHHLYGVSPATDIWSAGIFAERAAAVMQSIWDRGAVPIVVGGTGLWLKALIEGLSPIPDVPPAVVEQGERLWQGDPDELRRQLLLVDPQMERLKPADRQRHIRAWSVMTATGRSLSAWQAVPPIKVIDANFTAHVLVPPRADLYARCNLRFDQMMTEGVVEEVRALLDLSLPSTLPLMKAVGVPEIAAALRGDMSWDDATALAKQSTRRLAKRQMTWFRNQTEDWAKYTDAETLLQSAAAAFVTS